MQSELWMKRGEQHQNKGSQPKDDDPRREKHRPRVQWVDVHERPFREITQPDYVSIKAHVSGDRVPFFTIVRARVPDHDARALSEVAIRTMRVDGGDLAAVDGAELSVYLHSARRKDVSPFVERLRDEWRRIGKGEIEVDTLSYPADEQRVQELFGPAA